MLSIAKMVLITNLRKSKEILFLALFPILLMVMLGNILSNMMSGNVEIKDIKIYYYISEGDSNMTTAVEEIKENNPDSGIQFISIDDLEKGKEKVRRNVDSALLEIKDKKINIYTNNKDNTLAPFLSGLIESVTGRSNAIKQVYSINSTKGEEIATSSIDRNVEIKEIPKEKAPSSFDYYGVAEIGLMTFFMITFFVKNIITEKEKMIKERLNLTNTGFKYYLGYVLGSIPLSIIVTLPAYLFSIFFLNVNWGNVYTSYLLLLTFHFLAVSMGILIGSVFDRNRNVCSTLETMVFPVLIFLGGGYVSIGDNVDGVLATLTNISPLRWFNMGVMRMAFNDDITTYIIAFILNVVIGLMAIIMASVVAKRREAVV